ncbi:hypothetical protein POPTR_001G128700v4 [Populus trichocarpa]|uniref:AAA+ ATPase domain-containing protein n=1 Tax=Populus trichocarpa TaxID=3694 RepID=A0A3N7EIF5_POPTR|nr:cell division control protein 48 homolog B isoform X2 [Populus trichocarpa]RQO84800.1 hypothetical protein POPTR_001G128700v4 [Populus trichocarpa]|eukprot:XP_024455259.1 cell division control protein 48 homolog B isoform X2 [Populus trichocarpa]
MEPPSSSSGFGGGSSGFGGGGSSKVNNGTENSNNEWKAEEAIGGNKAALEALRELITFPLLYSREAQKLGLKWPTGLLLYGPPGTGKTSLVRAVVRECGAHLIVISPHFVHRAHAGESERVLREAFSDALSHAVAGKPSVIFIDEIDALCHRRDSRREQDVRVASQLFALMDANKPSSTSSAQVVVIASTNRVDAIDPALRRSGRFDAEIEVTTPTEEERLQILKKKLQQAVEWPIKHSAAFARMGISPIRGVLLHGPPGCSKTTLAKAAANAAQASFFSLSGAELYSMYVGEGEALLRHTFQRARLAAPSIIFFDEADVVAAKRGGTSSNSTTVGERLLSTLLTEMDGLEQSKGILVLAATNRPYAIDAALMRPGRFDLVLYVPPPDLEARYEILGVHTRKMKISNDVDLRRIAEDSELFTGAELEGLCREAGIVALRENISATVVCNRHFQRVKESLKPALTRAEVERYSSFMKTKQKRSGAIEFDPKPNTECKRNLLDSMLPVKAGVLSLVLLAASKYFLMFTKSARPDVPAT